MIGIFLGEQNSGKTLSMTYYAYRYYKRGYNVFSNYNLAFPHTKLTKELIQEYTKGMRQFDRSVFLLDEIYLFLDSRNFAKGINKILGYFLLQTSKRGVILFGTAQYFNTVEKRFRENSNFQCYCNRVYKTDEKFIDVKDSQRIINAKNLYIRQTFVSKRLEQGIIPTLDFKHYYLKAEPVFKMFDTKQLLAIE